MTFYKGIKFTDEHKKNLKIARNKRPPHSTETKKKISEGLKNAYNIGKKKPIPGLKYHKDDCPCSFCKQKRHEGFNFVHKKNCNCIPCRIKRHELKYGEFPGWKKGNIPWNFDKEFYEKMGIKKSFYPYSDKFNPGLKRKVRKFYGNRCVVTGMSNDEHKKLYRRPLFIHHWNYNKTEIDPYWMVPVCQTINNFAEQDKEGWISLFGGIVQEHYTKKTKKQKKKQ